MSQGLVTDLKITGANVTNTKAFVKKDLCPKSGMVFLDKSYDSGVVDEQIKTKMCTNETIRKRNHKRKNRDLDHWRSSVHMPFESTCSKVNKRCHYEDLEKVEFQALMEDTVQNLKRVLRISAFNLSF